MSDLPLPPLPEPVGEYDQGIWYDGDGHVDIFGGSPAYSKDQMVAYAREAMSANTDKPVAWEEAFAEVISKIEHWGNSRTDTPDDVLRERYQVMWDAVKELIAHPPAQVEKGLEPVAGGPWIAEKFEENEPVGPDHWRIHGADDSYEATLCEFWSGEHDNEKVAKQVAALLNAHPPTSEWNDAIEAAEEVVARMVQGADMAPTVRAVRRLKRTLGPADPICPSHRYGG